MHICLLNFFKDIHSFGSFSIKPSRIVATLNDLHEDFPQQCLVACIDQEDKFWHLLGFFEDFFANTNDTFSLDTTHDRLRLFYESFMLKLVELDQAEQLHEVLSHVERKYAKILTNLLDDLAWNSPLLIAACRKDCFHLVKVLVCKGCRLYTSLNKRNQDSWTRYPNFKNVNKQLALLRIELPLGTLNYQVCLRPPLHQRKHLKVETKSMICTCSD